MDREYELVPMQWAWHIDTVRAHVAKRCLTCHPTDCYLCEQLALFNQAGAHD